MDKEKIIELINTYWKFDNDQEHTSTWHDKQDLISAIEQLNIGSVSESTLTAPDIRNKLSPITHLISMVEREEPFYIKKAIPQAKKSVNYLAQREVYSR